MNFTPKPNDFDNFLEQPKLQKIVNDSFERYQEQAFLIENEALFRVSSYATKFLGIVSVIASLPMIINVLALTVIGRKVLNGDFSLTLALVVFGIMSVIFLGFTEYFKQSLFHRIVSNKLKNRKAQYEIIAFWVLILAFSAYTAIEGAAEVAKFSSIVKKEQLQDTDKIRQSYDTQIQELDKQIAAASKVGSGYSWGGALTDKGRSHVSQLNKQKQTLQQAKSGDLGGASTSNDNIKAEAALKGDENANLVRLVIAVIEVFIMFGCYYTEKYQYTVFMEVSYNGTKRERREKKNEVGIEKVEVQEQVEKGQKAIQAKSNPIGFHQQGNQMKLEFSPKPTENNLTASVGSELICDREGCGKDFIKKTTWHRFCSDECKMKAKSYDVKAVIKHKRKAKTHA